MLKIIGFGDNVVDRYLYKNKMYPGGNAVNVPVLAARTGMAKAAYIGVLGTDAAGVHVLSALRAEHVDLSRVRLLHGPNAYSDVTLVDGDRVFIGGSAGVSDQLVLEAEDVPYIQSYDLLHTSCYSYIDHLMPELHALNVPICYDYSDRLDFKKHMDTLPFVHIAVFSGGDSEEDMLRELARGAAAAGPDQVLVTMGSRGSLLYKDGRFFRQEIHRIKTVKDTMGAGDSFIARYLCGYFAGEDTRDSLHAAAVFAANNCLLDGTFGYEAEIS